MGTEWGLAQGRVCLAGVEVRWFLARTGPILRPLAAGYSRRGFRCSCEARRETKALSAVPPRNRLRRGINPRWRDALRSGSGYWRLDLESEIKNRLWARRRGVALLAVFSCVLLSGGGYSLSPNTSPRAGTPPVSSSPPSRAVHGALEQSLALANPSLSVGERARIVAAINRYSTRYQLDPDLVTAILLVESDARPWARSPKGAVGLMQVMPHMMRPMGLAGNLATVESNIEAGCFILAHNIERLGVEKGISAYFWGSRIRGVAYLEKVLEARARVRELRTS